MFDFSPLCVFKCLLKLLGSEHAYSHWLHLFDFSPLCVFKYFRKLPALVKQNHIVCICVIFLHCAFLYVSSNYLSMHDHTGCICFPFLLCGFSNEFSNGLPVRMQRHIVGHICATFLQWAFANASLNRLQCRPCI